MKYVSLLRGINVGGQKAIRMSDLKAVYESIGLKNVSTYIQSGNVVFEADLSNEAVLKRTIENAIQERYGFNVPVIILTNRQMGTVLKSNPFGVIDLEKEGTKVLVSFLAKKPLEEKVRRLEDFVVEPERLMVKDKQVYLHCPNGYGKSKLNNTFLENKLGVEASTRNLKTVNKLYELSNI